METALDTSVKTDIDTEALLTEAARFSAEDLRPVAEENDRAGLLPRAIITEMARRGFLGASLPVTYGGLGLDPLAYGRLTLAIGKGCPATRTLMTVSTSLVGESLARWGDAAQKQRYLPALARGELLGAFALTEPDQGSDAAAVQTRYERVGDGYRLTGKKRWISFGALADLLLVVARSATTQKLGVFIVETAGASSTLRITPMTGLLAGRATHLAEFELEGVEVPAEGLLGGEHDGLFPIVSSALDAGRYSVAWGGLAIAEAALEAMVTYALSRRQFGVPISEHQLVRELIAEATAQVHAGRALCLRAGELRRDRDPNGAVETTIAKYFTSRAAMAIATDAVQVHGGNGCSDRYPVARLFREAKVLEIIEGTSQIQQGLIAEFSLGAYRLVQYP